jgi:hypothetical protein
MASDDAQRFQIRDDLLPRLFETTSVRAEWIHFSGGGYFDKHFSMFTSDTAPDLYCYTPAYVVESVAANGLRNLTPLIKRDTYGRSDYPERAIVQYTYQGNRHGFPQDFPTRALCSNPEQPGGVQARRRPAPARQLRPQPQHTELAGLPGDRPPALLLLCCP